MRQPAGTVWAERALMVLFLASLAGTLEPDHDRAPPGGSQLAIGPSRSCP